MFQIVKFHEANGNQIKSVLCLDGEFHIEKHVDVKVGMTSLQFRFAKHARSWRMMCDALLRPAKYDYQIEPFPHPSGDMKPWQPIAA